MNNLSLRKQLALEINRKIWNNLKELHPLKQLFWECTLRCNLHCKHCGSDCKRMAAVEDMPAEDFLRTIDSITPYVNPNKVSIIITGGEPLMREDLEKVGLAHLPSWLSVGHGLQWTLSDKGTLATSHGCRIAFHNYQSGWFCRRS